MGGCRLGFRSLSTRDSGLDSGWQDMGHVEGGFNGGVGIFVLRHSQGLPESLKWAIAPRTQDLSGTSGALGLGIKWLGESRL